MQRIVLLTVCLIGLGVNSCASVREIALELSLEEVENTKVAKQIAINSLETAPYWNGFLRGLLGTRTEELPAHVLEAMDELDQLAALYECAGEVSAAELGRVLGLRARILCAAVKEVLQMYAPDVVGMLPL